MTNPLDTCATCPHVRRLHRPRCACGCTGMTDFVVFTLGSLDALSETAAKKLGPTAGQKSDGSSRQNPTGKSATAPAPCAVCGRKRGHRKDCTAPRTLA